MPEDYETQKQLLLDKQPREAIRGFLTDVYDYINYVNRVSELMRLSEGIGTEPLDHDITVGDVMLSLVRKGEMLRTTAEIMHEYSAEIEK